MTGRQTEAGALPGVDLEVVVGWLGDAGLEVSAPLTGQRVGVGQSNLTYLLMDAAGRQWILRRPPLGSLLQSAHDVAREHRIMAALNRSAVPVPKVIGLWHDQTDQLLMDYVDGLVIDRMEVAAGQSELVRAAAGRSIARTLAEIHAVDLERAGLLDLASHRPYAERQLKRWERQLEASKTRERPDLDRLTARLRASVPAQRELVLVHGDLHIRNVICAAGTGEVLAALDWELSTLGDPIADLGTLLAYWPEKADSSDWRFAASTLPGFPSQAELVDEYVLATGRDIAALGFWHVLGVWKVAIIAEGIRQRFQGDARNAPTGGPPSPASIDYLVDEAWELVDRYRI